MDKQNEQPSLYTVYQLGGKSNIICNLWEQELLENKRIARESIKLLLENNPVETNELRIKMKTDIEEKERNKRRKADELHAKSWGNECDFIIETWKPDSKIVNIITSPISKGKKKGKLK